MDQERQQPHRCAPTLNACCAAGGRAVRCPPGSGEAELEASCVCMAGGLWAVRLRPVHGELAFLWCLALGPTLSKCSCSHLRGRSPFTAKTIQGEGAFWFPFWGSWLCGPPILLHKISILSPVLGSSFKSYTWNLKNNRKDPLALKVSEQLPAAAPLASPPKLPRHHPTLHPAQQNSYLGALSKMRCLEVFTNRVALITAPGAGSVSHCSLCVKRQAPAGPLLCSLPPAVHRLTSRGALACGQLTPGNTDCLQPVASHALDLGGGLRQRSVVMFNQF